MFCVVEGVGFWAPGLPSWQAARDYVGGGALAADAPRKPSPELLPPNERRRASESVSIALQVAADACRHAGRDPATLPSVFASTHGDMAITDYICATLAGEPRAMSPTRFHNSVHNAAAGYWTIGNGCRLATTAISALDASFAQGLLEALAQLHDGAEAILLAAYDTAASGPLGTVTRSEGVLGGALVLSRRDPDRPDARAIATLRATLVDGEPPAAPAGALARLGAGNAMAPMLPLFDALAGGDDVVPLKAGPGRVLRVEIAHG
nr:beta-ketoacyl synthase chain length factor [Luteimonas aquatica]